MARYGEQPQRARMLCSERTWSSRAWRCSRSFSCSLPSCGSAARSLRRIARVSSLRSGGAGSSSGEQHSGRPGQVQLGATNSSALDRRSATTSTLARGGEHADGVDRRLGLSAARRAADASESPASMGSTRTAGSGRRPAARVRRPGLRWSVLGKAPRLEDGGRPPGRRPRHGPSAATSGLFWLIQGSSRLPERSANVETSRLCSISAPWIGWIQGAQAVEHRLRIVPGRAVGHPGHGVDVEHNPVDGL